MYFWLFMCNLILPATACVLAYLGCYTMAGWALFGGIIAFSVPHGKIKADKGEDLDRLERTLDKIQRKTKL